MMFLISLWFFFPDFSAPLTNTVREEKADAQASMYTPNSTSGNAHPDASLSVLLATYSGERRHGLSAETSYDAQALWKETWTYRVWEILNEPGCKDILEVTTLCFKHGVLLFWTAALEPWGLPRLFLLKDSSILVAALHLHTFTYTISLWTLCKWIRLDFLTQFIQGSKLSYIYRYEAIVSTYLSSLFKRQFLMHFPVFIIHSYFLSCSFLTFHLWMMNK